MIGVAITPGEVTSPNPPAPTTIVQARAGLFLAESRVSAAKPAQQGPMDQYQ